MAKNGDGCFEWDGRNPAGKAIKAALDALAALSEKLVKAINELPKDAPAAVQAALDEAVLRNDRRASEIQTLFCDFADMAEKAFDDPANVERLGKTLASFLPAPGRRPRVRRQPDRREQGEDGCARGGNRGGGDKARDELKKLVGGASKDGYDLGELTSEQLYLLSRELSEEDQDRCTVPLCDAFRAALRSYMAALKQTGRAVKIAYGGLKGVATQTVHLAAMRKTVDDRADAQSLAAAIVRGRNEGFIRAFPILGLVYLSKKNAHLFQDAFKKVILTGNDLVDFIEVAKTVRGFGRSLKTAIADWIASNTNPYYAQKYRKQIADAIRLSHFKGEDSIT